MSDLRSVSNERPARNKDATMISGGSLIRLEDTKSTKVVFRERMCTVKMILFSCEIIFKKKYF